VVRGRWFTPIILATQEAEMRTTVQNQPGKIVCETLSQKKKKPITKTGCWSGSKLKAPSSNLSTTKKKEWLGKIKLHGKTGKVEIKCDDFT
jgi:hypothetical protein